MNEITRKDEALRLHTQICIYAEQLQNSVYMMGKLMSDMKDKELFKDLGYESFDAYANMEFGLKKSQSAKYISIFNKLGKDYIESKQSLGVTKLYLLSQLEEDDREVIEVSAEDASVSQLKLEIEKLKEEKEKMQFRFFEIESENEKIKSENKDLKDKPQEVAIQMPDQAEIEKLAEEMAEEKTKLAKQRIEELNSKLAEKDKEIKGYDAQIRKVAVLETDNQMMKQKIEQDKAKVDEFENIKKAYEMKIENLNKKLEESTQVDDEPEGMGLDEEATFKFMMKQFVGTLNDICDFVDNAEDRNLKGKLVVSIQKILNRLEGEE